jgi:signal transduction histidine kinase
MAQSTRTDGLPPSAEGTLLKALSEARRSQGILLAQKEALEHCAQGDSLDVLLDRLVRTIEEHSVDGAIPSILLVEDGRLRHMSAPHLAPAYIAALDGAAPGPAVGSCGTAAFTRRAVFVSDIETDPLWNDFRAVALAHDLRACWSVPIISAGGDVLGTFALYYREPRTPSSDDIALIELMSRSAAILIDWRQAEEGRQRLLEAERKARQAAEAASHAKDEFVATLSHELRTPLNAIIGWARMLRLTDVDKAIADRAITSIERNAQAQARLVDDLLDIARIVSGKLRLDLSIIDLGGLTEGALDTVKPLADAKGIRLTSTCPPLGVMVRADAARLRQVLLNLLTNAVKFTPSGGDVALEVGRAGGEIQVSVSDTGVGIAGEVLPHIFDRYRQGDPGSGGLGLGLAIARHVAELHGGSLRAASAGLGKGSRFDLLLPVPQRLGAAVA